jgi:calcineurin-like phosphoesterase family protein
MAIRTFVIADTHWSQESVCEYSKKHDNKMRPWDSAEEMDEAMIELWNETVRPKDKVIHLGDVSPYESGVRITGYLHGRHTLIKGNYDRLSLSLYAEYFDDIFGCLSLDRFILSHIPVSDHQKYRYRGNIHGHLHCESLEDPWYQCVSVEQTEFKPILLDEVKARYDVRNA